MRNSCEVIRLDFSRKVLSQRVTAELFPAGPECPVGRPTDCQPRKGVSKGVSHGLSWKISPKFFRLNGRPHGMSTPKCSIFQDLEGLTEVFGWMSAGISGPKPPLWADFRS